MIDSTPTTLGSLHGFELPVTPSYDVRATMPPTLAMTAHGLAALRRDLERLQDERDQEIAQRLRAARTSGDTTGNDEYLSVKEDELVLSARIASLEDLLHRATVADGAIDGQGIVGIGSSVSIEFIASGATAFYRIVGAHEPLGAGAASAASPLGRALVGQEPGALVQFELPNGHAQHLRIIATRASTSHTD